MAKVYYGKMNNQNQLDNKYYQADNLPGFLNNLQVGDYAFISNTIDGEVFALWKAKQIQGNKMFFEEIFKFKKRQPSEFICLNIFKLNTVLLNHTVKQIKGRSFFELDLDSNGKSIFDNFNANKKKDINGLKNYIENDDNYRKLVVVKQGEAPKPDSRDVQLYWEDGIIKIYECDFVDNSFVSNFKSELIDANYDANPRKKDFVQKILKSRENGKVFNKKLVSMYDIFLTNNNKSTTQKPKEAPKTNSANEQVFSNYDNIIIFGIPGCGKSYYLNNTLIGQNYKYVVRTTFYPDYSNYDFIGQLRPIKIGNNIDYKIIPGQFTYALGLALKNPKENVALVIEELNRGNAAAIFGDVFQLLDRTGGVSEYPIKNMVIETYLKEEYGIDIQEIRLPKNLKIFATMNSSDQNVFKLDTAFKRRWSFIRRTNKMDSNNPNIRFKVDDTIINDWKIFVDSINSIILQHKDDLNGDRQIGYWFVKKGISKYEFANKVLEYLYNDVLKYVDKSMIFDNKYDSLSFDDVYDDFVNGKNVFNASVKLDEIQNENTKVVGD